MYKDLSHVSWKLRIWRTRIQHYNNLQEYVCKNAYSVTFLRKCTSVHAFKDSRQTFTAHGRLDPECFQQTGGSFLREAEWSASQNRFFASQTEEDKLKSSLTVHGFEYEVKFSSDSSTWRALFQNTALVKPAVSLLSLIAPHITYHITQNMDYLTLVNNDCTINGNLKRFSDFKIDMM